MLLRKKLVFLNLLVVLTLMVSGCLPSIPKEIHGPTWTCNYRFPLIKEKQISVKEALKEGIDHGLSSPGTFRVAGAEPATVEDNSSSSFERVNIFYTIKNDSPIDLNIKIRFAPDPLDQADDADKIETNVTIEANKTGTSVLSIEPDKFSALISSGEVYNDIEITSVKSIEERPDLLGIEDYMLELTAWAEVTRTFNKR